MQTSKKSKLIFKMNQYSKLVVALLTLLFFSFFFVVDATSSVVTSTLTTTYISGIIDYDQVNWPTLCVNGLKQSPIDLPIDPLKYNTTSVVQIVSVNYNILNRVPLEILNGKSFMVNASDLGYLIVKKNGLLYQYDAADVHFHFPSEHTIGGKYADVEMHMRHNKRSSNFKELNNRTNDTTFVDPDEKNPVLNMGILFKGDSLIDNKFIKALKVDRNGPVSKLDLRSFPPIHSEFYFYEGSSTTPGCAENNNWIVAKKVESMSKAQTLYFVNWITTIYGLNGNNRFIQKINNRKIYLQYYPAPDITTFKAMYFLSLALLLLVTMLAL